MSAARVLWTLFRGLVPVVGLNTAARTYSARATICDDATAAGEEMRLVMDLKLLLGNEAGERIHADAVSEARRASASNRWAVVERLRVARADAMAMHPGGSA